MRTSCPCRLFLKERFGIPDLWRLLRLSLSKVGKCPVYLIVEKQAIMWLRAWALKSDHEGSNPSSTLSQLYDFGQFSESFFFFVCYGMEMKAVPPASGCRQDGRSQVVGVLGAVPGAW